jgi:hypothetical protein
VRAVLLDPLGQIIRAFSICLRFFVKEAGLAEREGAIRRIKAAFSGAVLFV